MDGTGARRHEAGEPSYLLCRLHCSYSADSRSRPPRPSRHIRDTGPDGVRERRAPLTWVRYSLCYLGWSRLVRALSGSCRARALSSSEPPLEESPSWLPLTLPAPAAALRGWRRSLTSPI